MDISSGKAMIFSVVAGGPSLAVATIDGDFIPVATGIAVGTLMFWWSIRNTSNDQYIKNLHNRIQESQDEIRDGQKVHHEEIERMQSTLTEVQMKVKRHEFVLDQIQKRLAVHSCPAPRDPNAACRLPEIISSTLSL